jgi:hypothetical protein
MQNAGFPVHRLADGAIDYGFYRAEAARLRAQSLQQFWREIGRRWAARLSTLNSRPSSLAPGSAVAAQAGSQAAAQGS